MHTEPTPKIHPLSILGVLLVAGALVGITWLVFSFAVSQAPQIEATPQYNVTVIPAPTQTIVFVCVGAGMTVTLYCDRHSCSNTDEYYRRSD